MTGCVVGYACLGHVSCKEEEGNERGGGGGGGTAILTEVFWNEWCSVFGTRLNCWRARIRNPTNERAIAEAEIMSPIFSASKASGYWCYCRCTDVPGIFTSNYPGIFYPFESSAISVYHFNTNKTVFFLF